MSFESVKAKNPGVKMYQVTDPEFKKYGRVVTGYDFTPYVDYLKSNTEVPESGNKYVGSVAEMEALPLTAEVEHYIFAGVPVQVGYCNGNGSLLSAFEYHKCSEVSVGPTDMVFMMYKVEDGGFKCLVILTKGTNEPIEKPANPVNHEDRLIMAVNKWAFGHKDSSVVASRGGFEGIFGENTEIKY